VDILREGEGNAQFFESGSNDFDGVLYFLLI